ncbi:anti-sigma factor [Mycobacterium botniense]|uniref:Anti-sigma-K factor RskA n=1 Tax=Mycobacterium botniense TaxID=84962 RepID=A0A7I9XTW3_9MYCO|nr:anti-sigma factor [Mycobacterium botniense]GFG73442.1 anti-sigma-K factor RskA [Mycobacterium botniense]
MTEPADFELLELAAPYALHAVSDAERADIERRLAAASPPVAQAFRDEVRAVRETMAAVSAATTADPPAHLRARILAAAKSGNHRNFSWRTVFFAAAASIVVGLAAFGIGIALRPSPAPPVAEQVLAAPDVRTVSGALGSGTATLVFSRDRNAGVLVMNNVPPPSPGKVYQIWLVSTHGPRSAGTMGALAPSATAVVSNLKGSTALAFTVEPGPGSPQPTGAILATLPLS